MNELKLGDLVTINGPSIQGEIVGVWDSKHEPRQYQVQRYDSTARRVREWYHWEEITFRPDEVKQEDDTGDDSSAEFPADG